MSAMNVTPENADGCESAELVNELRRRCAEAGGVTPWARANGLSVAFVHDVTTGRRSVSARLASVLGFERRVIFTRQEPK